MGKKDSSLVNYFSDEVRYADLINTYVMEGKQVVDPKDVREMDSRVNGILGRFGRKKRWIYVEKYRDIVRKIVLDTVVVVVGLENQDQIHYAMPVRILMEDAAGYDGQVRRIQKKHRRLRDLRGAEYVGRFAKEDKVYPILTIVVYYGEKPWDGPRDLHGMMNLEKVPEEMRRRINNYPIHILEVRNYPAVGKFQSDLREVVGFLQHAEDKKAIWNFVEAHKERFEHMEEDAYDLISVLSGMTELEERKGEYQEEGGTVNMCEGIRGLIEDGRLEGHKEGLQEGIEQGTKTKAERVAQNMFSRGMSVEDAAAICEEDIRLVQRWFDKWKKKRR